MKKLFRISPAPERPASFLSRREWLGLAAAAGLASLTPATSWAQGFGPKQIRLMVGVPPGGSNDFGARLIAPYLSEALGTTVLVENKVGAAGTIATDYVAKSPPDGTTLFFGGTGPMLIAPQALPKQPFKFPTDIQAINTVGETPLGIAIDPSLGVKTLPEFLALAHKRQLSLASTGIGSLPHLVIETLIKASGADIVHVPYKGGGPAINDAMGGYVSGVVQDVPTFLPLHKAGKLILVAVTSAKRAVFLPDVPTVVETLPSFFSASSTLGLYAPIKTPKQLIDSLNAAVLKIMAKEEVRKRFLDNAIEPKTQASPEAFQKISLSEYDRWGKLLREKGIVIAS